MNVFSAKASEQEESHWLSVSDLMAGLMMVFLFIAVALMMQTRSIASSYEENQLSIYKALLEEFQQDLGRWDAEIDKDTLTFVFKSPEVLFAQGKADLTIKYRDLLADFFPRYMKVLNHFKRSITEVRIEGHTSSVWNSYVSDTEAYFRNMELSQDRTRAVLSYVYQLPDVASQTSWIKKNMAAVGLSSSKVILNGTQVEDRLASRRVTFRVITNADEEIRKILE